MLKLTNSDLYKKVMGMGKLGEKGGLENYSLSNSTLKYLLITVNIIVINKN